LLAAKTRVAGAIGKPDAVFASLRSPLAKATSLTVSSCLSFPRIHWLNSRTKRVVFPLRLAPLIQIGKFTDLPLSKIIFQRMPYRSFKNEIKLTRNQQQN
jgi:hypothetical protein